MINPKRLPYTLVRIKAKGGKKIHENYENKIVIPLYVYYDDFEINNALSTATGIHKIGGFYYCIVGLPSQFSSTIDNVFLGLVIYSMDQKDFGNAKCFRKVTDELTFFIKRGYYSKSKW